MPPEIAWGRSASVGPKSLFKVARLENLLETGDDHWDVLLAADVGYLRENFQWLTRLAETGRTILLADPGRSGLPTEQLEPLARFAVRTFPELEDPDMNEAVVYRFRAD